MTRLHAEMLGMIEIANDVQKVTLRASQIQKLANRIPVHAALASTNLSKLHLQPIGYVKDATSVATASTLTPTFVTGHLVQRNLLVCPASHVPPQRLKLPAAVEAIVIQYAVSLRNVKGTSGLSIRDLCQRNLFVPRAHVVVLISTKSGCAVVIPTAHASNGQFAALPSSAPAHCCLQKTGVVNHAPRARLGTLQ